MTVKTNRVASLWSGLLLVVALTPSVLAVQGEDETERKESDLPDVDQVLARAESTDSFQLVLASASALTEKRFNDAAFLLQAGQLRALVDQKVFPPKGTGGNSPMIALNALFFKVGYATNPIWMRDRERYADVLKRLEQWNPEFPDSYSPGWEYTNAVPPEDRREIVDELKNEALNSRREFKRLLANDEYFQLLRRIQEGNLSVELMKFIEGEDYEPAQISFDELTKLEERAAEIEQEMGIAGAFSREVEETTQEE